MRSPSSLRLLAILLLLVLGIYRATGAADAGPARTAPLALPPGAGTLARVAAAVNTLASDKEVDKLACKSVAGRLVDTLGAGHVQTITVESGAPADTIGAMRTLLTTRITEPTLYAFSVQASIVKKDYGWLWTSRKELKKPEDIRETNTWSEQNKRKLMLMNECLGSHYWVIVRDTNDNGVMYQAYGATKRGKSYHFSLSNFLSTVFTLHRAQTMDQMNETLEDMITKYGRHTPHPWAHFVNAIMQMIERPKVSTNFVDMFGCDPGPKYRIVEEKVSVYRMRDEFH